MGKAKMLLDTVFVQELSDQMSDQMSKEASIWELLKTKVRFGWTIVATEASWMDNKVMHYAWENDFATLSTMVAEGKIEIHFFQGVDAESTYAAMYGKKFFNSLFGDYTEMEPGLPFSTIVRNFPAEYRASAEGLYALAREYAYGKGMWDMTPGWPKHEYFSADELTTFSLSEESANNRSVVLEAVRNRNYRRWVQYIRTYTDNIRRQHKCKCIFGAAELEECASLTC